MHNLRFTGMNRYQDLLTTETDSEGKSGKAELKIRASNNNSGFNYLKGRRDATN